MKTFSVYNNVLSEELFEQIKIANLTIPWMWATESIFGSLYTSLNEYDFFAKDFVELISDLTKTKHTLKRCYRSGCTPISIGTMHYDTHEKSDVTFLYYAHPEWEVDWGGETFFDDEKGKQRYVKPIPNSGAYFSAEHWKHQGRPFTMNTNLLRITYVWKLMRV